MQVMHVLGTGARAFDDDIGVFFENIRAADFQTLGTGLFQKPSRGLTALGFRCGFNITKKRTGRRMGG